MTFAASLRGAELIRNAISERGVARIVAATGLSQREFLAHLIGQKDIDWKRVVLFHLDEYLGISPEHPASMHIRERIVEPANLRNVVDLALPVSVKMAISLSMSPGRFLYRVAIHTRSGGTVAPATGQRRLVPLYSKRPQTSRDHVRPANP